MFIGENKGGSKKGHLKEEMSAHPRKTDRKETGNKRGKKNPKGRILGTLIKETSRKPEFKAIAKLRDYEIQPNKVNLKKREYIRRSVKDEGGAR